MTTCLGHIHWCHYERSVELLMALLVPRATIDKEHKAQPLSSIYSRRLSECLKRVATLVWKALASRCRWCLRTTDPEKIKDNVNFGPHRHSRKSRALHSYIKVVLYLMQRAAPFLRRIQKNILVIVDKLNVGYDKWGIKAVSSLPARYQDGARTSALRRVRLSRRF